MAEHVHRNVTTVAELHATFAGDVSRHQRLVERLTHRIGRPSTLYGLLGLAAAWMAFNLLAPLIGLRQLDEPPFFWLQGAISLFAATTSVVVITTQIRQGRQAERRAQLELQVNLLAEQKATKIIALLEELRHDLPFVNDRKDSLAEAMTTEVDPRAVLSALEDTMENTASDDEGERKP